MWSVLNNGIYVSVTELIVTLEYVHNIYITLM